MRVYNPEGLIKYLINNYFVGSDGVVEVEAGVSAGAGVVGAACVVSVATLSLLSEEEDGGGAGFL